MGTSNSKRQTGGRLSFLGVCGVPLSVFWAALGCQAQAGESYTGEALFSLRGEVVLREPGAGDVVPAVVFFGSAPTVVDGEVRGDFPARFQLDLMTPPPPSAFVPAEFLMKPDGWNGESR